MNVVAALALLLGTLGLRLVLHSARRQTKLHSWGLPWALLFQPYTIFCCILSAFYVWSVMSFFSLMSKYHWLDSGSFVRPPGNVTYAAQMEEFAIPEWLGLLCKACPFFMFATFVVTFVHLALHLPPRPTGCGEDMRWFPTFSHDLAMQVTALPLVYGAFALDNVLTLLEVFTGNAYLQGTPERSPGQEYETWNSSVLLMNQAYETNFELADLYEAWALRCFGLLCFTLVRRQVLLEAPTVKYLIDTVKHHISSVAGENAADARLLKEVTLLDNPQKLLFEPLQQTSNMGVMVFVYTYAAKSAYSLTLTTAAEFNMQLCGANGLMPAACSLMPYAEGAAMLASTLAIMNIVVFEKKLKVILGRLDFRPFAKFLAVKVLVSIVFIQQFALQVLMGSRFSEAQVNLCYSCLICVEVLPLSILVLCAWRPRRDDWYQGDFIRDGGGLVKVDLADGSGSFMTTDSFVRSRQPASSIRDRGALPHELTAFVELRGEVRPQDGRALVDIINSLSQGRIHAEYKLAALYRDHGLRPPLLPVMPSSSFGEFPVGPKAC